MDGVRRCVAQIHNTNCGDITADDLNERQREAGVDDKGEVIEISKWECIIWLAKTLSALIMRGYHPSISVHIGAPGIQVYILMHLQQDE
ncbi:hypothetical protein C5167_041833 [Papaver somniferum]|nr:hypothetical protein C5167_041833 [Papaver somniferum]